MPGNGREVTSTAMSFWARKNKVRLCSIQPGMPTECALVICFKAKFREYRLDLNWWFASLHDAGSIIVT